MAVSRPLAPRRGNCGGTGSAARPASPPAERALGDPLRVFGPVPSRRGEPASTHSPRAVPFPGFTATIVLDGQDMPAIPATSHPHTRHARSSGPIPEPATRRAGLAKLPRASRNSRARSTISAKAPANSHAAQPRTRAPAARCRVAERRYHAHHRRDHRRPPKARSAPVRAPRASRTARGPPPWRANTGMASGSTVAENTAGRR